MGQENAAPRRINKVEGLAGQPMVSGGPDQLEKWSHVVKLLRLPMEQFRKGVAAPTEATKGGAAGFLFDSDNEILYVQFCVPKDWDGESNIIVILHCILNQAEALNDKIDWETSVISIADHENALAAGVQTPGVVHDIVSVNADGDLHQVPIVLAYDSGTCPISHGDNVSIELSRTTNVGNAGYVGGVVVIDICIQYQSDRLGDDI